MNYKLLNVILGKMDIRQGQCRQIQIVDGATIKDFRMDAKREKLHFQKQLSIRASRVKGFETPAVKCPKLGS